MPPRSSRAHFPGRGAERSGSLGSARISLRRIPVLRTCALPGRPPGLARSRLLPGEEVRVLLGRLLPPVNNPPCRGHLRRAILRGEEVGRRAGAGLRLGGDGREVPAGGGGEFDWGKAGADEIGCEIT